MSDQYEQREANYLDSIGGRVAGIVVPLAEAHCEMQRRYALDVAKALTEQVPIKVAVDRSGQRYELTLWMPLLLVTAVRPLDYDQGTGVSTRMSVSAQQSSETERRLKGRGRRTRRMGAGVGVVQGGSNR